MEPQQAAVAAHQEGYASEQAVGRTALLHVRVTAQTPQLLVLLRGSGGIDGYHSRNSQGFVLLLLRGSFTQYGSFTLVG